jgi:hypothetical protein
MLDENEVRVHIQRSSPQVVQISKKPQSPRPIKPVSEDISISESELHRKQNAAPSTPLEELKELSDSEEIQPKGPTSEDRKPALSQIAATKAYNMLPFVYNEAILPSETKGPELMSDGSVYIGEWKNGERYGKGRCYVSDGSYMEGYWSNGLLHRKGRTIQANGDVYEGGYLHGKREGKGRFEDATGATRYEGDWHEGYMHGHGHQICEGRDYEGDFVMGVKQGEGVMQWDGKTYKGAFVNNQMHGNGDFTESDGRHFKHVYNNGKLLVATPST